MYKRQGQPYKSYPWGYCLIAGVTFLCACQNNPVFTPTIVKEITPQASNTPTMPAPTSTIIEPVCHETTGKIFSDQVESAILETQLPFRIYLPPCYGQEPGLDYPVLYLLHGLYSDENQWEQLNLALSADRLIQSGGSVPFLVVMPKVPDISTYPSTTNTQVIAEELVPYVDTHYLARNGRSSRAIGGLSRGATWALRIGLSEWQLFGKIGLHSVALEINEVRSWVRVLSKMDAIARPALFLDTGNLDDDQFSVQSLDLELNRAKLPHTYHLFTGSHDEAYWREHLPIYLEWYTLDW